MKNPENPPAFPRPSYAHPSSNLEASERAELLHGSEVGMSLRDWFAGQALAGFLASQGSGLQAVPGEVAEKAYLAADAMLVEREKDR